MLVIDIYVKILQNCAINESQFSLSKKNSVKFCSIKVLARWEGGQQMGRWSVHGEMVSTWEDGQQMGRTMFAKHTFAEQYIL